MGYFTDNTNAEQLAFIPPQSLMFLIGLQEYMQDNGIIPLHAGDLKTARREHRRLRRFDFTAPDGSPARMTFDVTHADPEAVENVISALEGLGLCRK